jgi:hypothetical protein
MGAPPSTMTNLAHLPLPDERCFMPSSAHLPAVPRRRLLVLAVATAMVAATALSWISTRHGAAADIAPPASRSSLSEIQAELPNAQSGTITEPTTDIGGGLNAGYIAKGDWLQFDKINFPAQAPANFVRIRVASGARAGVTGAIEVRLDGPTGDLLASIPVASTGGWQSWVTTEVAMKRSVANQHNVYVSFVSGQRADFVNVNWISFT